jgi:hypothetical protein
MVLGLLLALTIVAAVAAVGRRRWHRARLVRAGKERLGASADLAIAIRSFAEMDDHLGPRWCVCGGYLERSGEGSRTEGGRRYRVARLVCQECERVEEVYFDTTDVIH